MIKGLYSKSKFRQDLEKYQEAVSSISDTKIRQKGETLLKEFRSHANLIDETHTTIGNGYIDPRMTRNNVEHLLSARLKLDRFIKDLYA